MYLLTGLTVSSKLRDYRNKVVQGYVCVEPWSEYDPVVGMLESGEFPTMAARVEKYVMQLHASIGSWQSMTKPENPTPWDMVAEEELHRLHELEQGLERSKAAESESRRALALLHERSILLEESRHETSLLRARYQGLDGMSEHIRDLEDQVTSSRRLVHEYDETIEELHVQVQNLRAELSTKQHSRRRRDDGGLGAAAVAPLARALHLAQQDLALQRRSHVDRTVEWLDAHPLTRKQFAPQENVEGSRMRLFVRFFCWGEANATIYRPS